MTIANSVADDLRTWSDRLTDILNSEEMKDHPDRSALDAIITGLENLSMSEILNLSPSGNGHLPADVLSLFGTLERKIEEIQKEQGKINERTAFMDQQIGRLRGKIVQTWADPLITILLSKARSAELTRLARTIRAAERMGMSVVEFEEQLHHPDGGEIGQIEGVGNTTIQKLRDFLKFVRSDPDLYDSVIRPRLSQEGRAEVVIDDVVSGQDGQEFDVPDEQEEGEEDIPEPDENAPNWTEKYFGNMDHPSAKRIQLLAVGLLSVGWEEEDFRHELYQEGGGRLIGFMGATMDDIRLMRKYIR
jgi:hypothetical protein